VWLGAAAGGAAALLLGGLLIVAYYAAQEQLIHGTFGLLLGAALHAVAALLLAKLALKTGRLAGMRAKMERRLAAGFAQALGGGPPAADAEAGLEADGGGGGGGGVSGVSGGGGGGGGALTSATEKAAGGGIGRLRAAASELARSPVTWVRRLSHEERSLFALAFVSVVREGVESFVFLAGVGSPGGVGATPAARLLARSPRRLLPAHSFMPLPPLPARRVQAESSCPACWAAPPASPSALPFMPVASACRWGR
jgi:hypothetical protein